jgi:RNA polymerase sigma factor (sigma-70 family)
MPYSRAAYQRGPVVLFLHRRDKRNLAVPDWVSGRRIVHVAETAEVSRLVQASVSGDQAAWNELVRRYAPLVMAVIRRHQLTAADAQDVSQTVWLRLVEHLAGLRKPEALPGWLATTTQRECRRHIRQAWQALPVDPHAKSAAQQPVTIDLDADIIRAELRQALREGLSELPARDQRLLRLRAADPPASYQEISRLMGIPTGSIGPTLRRSLDKLRESQAMRAYVRLTPTTPGGTGGAWRELADVE